MNILYYPVKKDERLSVCLDELVHQKIRSISQPCESSIFTALMSDEVQYLIKDGWILDVTYKDNNIVVSMKDDIVISVPTPTSTSCVEDLKDIEWVFVPATMCYLDVNLGGVYCK